MPTDETWYAARLIFVSESAGRTGPDALFDASIRVCRASSEEEASARLLEYGRESEHDYLNDSGETVRWKFLGLEDVQNLAVETIEDGCEVFSQLQRTDPRRQ